MCVSMSFSVFIRSFQRFNLSYVVVVFFSFVGISVMFRTHLVSSLTTAPSAPLSIRMEQTHPFDRLTYRIKSTELSHRCLSDNLVVNAEHKKHYRGNNNELSKRKKGQKNEMFGFEASEKKDDIRKKKNGFSIR